MTFLINIPRPITIAAMNKLAEVDYNIATKVSEDIALTVKWAYTNNYPLIAKEAIQLLQVLDNFGSLLISIVVWIVNHTM